MRKQKSYRVESGRRCRRRLCRNFHSRSSGFLPKEWSGEYERRRKKSQTRGNLHAFLLVIIYFPPPESLPSRTGAFFFHSAGHPGRQTASIANQKPYQVRLDLPRGTFFHWIERWFIPYGVVTVRTSKLLRLFCFRANIFGYRHTVGRFELNEPMRGSSASTAGDVLAIDIVVNAT